MSDFVFNCLTALLFVFVKCCVALNEYFYSKTYVSDMEYDHLDYTRPVTTAKPHYQKPHPYQQSNGYVLPKADEEDTVFDVEKQ